MEKAEMETGAARLTQDQNSDVDFDGSLVGGKKNGSKAQKKGGGQKAHNDISKSAKPSALQPSTKRNSLNAEQKVLKNESDKNKKLLALQDEFRQNESSHHQECCFKSRHRRLPNTFFSAAEGDIANFLGMEEIPKPVFEMEKQPKLSEKQPTDQNNGIFAYKLLMELAALDCELIPSDEEESKADDV